MKNNFNKSQLNGNINRASFNDDRDDVMSALVRMDAQAETPPARQLPQHGDRVENFIAAAAENAATTVRLPNESAIPAAAASYLRENQLPPFVVCTAEWLPLNWHAVGLSAECRAPTDDDVCGLSGIVAAAADYGAMLVDSTHPHQLTISLLPPHHLAVLRAQDIYASLENVLEKSFAASPRARNIICGPSRTADIEQTLTLGAHGPVAVHIMIIEVA